ncbi:PEP/pyruvate-binding domain-containing protein [Streptomyces sp. JHA26]|uniref:PEP/pyruvate-binding domain-containing protein n=1 Tax=Streptomyces sp. JHA26 TaxID=1917143 RepID=UPI00117D9C7C|nr:PEP/pyruvate-binding domain-containing protein [Streptomyces sp. JHA26]
MIETLHDPLRPAQVGWKFARLKVLHDAGVRVPPLFCLTGDAYRRAVGPLTARIDDVLDRVDPGDWHTLREASARIRALVEGVGLDATTRTALREAVERWFPGSDTLLAVRASVLAGCSDRGEDSADHPFAGMSDSFLYVRAEDVAETVLRCWSSAFSPESLLYRRRQGLSTRGLAVAVGVQEMVLGERSLVMFTADAATYARRTVISAGWGIGEGVVQERTATDHFFVTPGTDRVERTVAFKPTMLALDAERGHGIVEVEVPKERRDGPVLSDEEVVLLARLGRRIEDLFGAPQDIEATLTADGIVHVVQSRPIAMEPARHRVWSNANVSESFPGTTTPMTYSVARRFYALLNHDYLRRCGVDERQLEEVADCTGRLLGYLDGRIYHNITSFTAMLSALPMFEGLRRDWERLVAELDTVYHEPARPPAGRAERLRRLGSLAAGWTRAGRNLVTLPRDFSAFERAWQRLLRDKRGSAQMPGRHPLVLVADFREVWRAAARMWGVTLINYQFMVLYHKVIEQLLERWGVTDQDVLFSQLLCGGPQLRGAEIALGAVRLGELVRDDEQLLARFTEADPHALWRELESGRLPADFAAAVRTHLRRYGDRGIEELKLEQPNPRDTPWELLKVVRQYALSGVRVADLERSEWAERAEGEERLRRLLPRRPLERGLLLFLFDRLRTHLYYREAGRYMRSELFGYTKQVIAVLGADLHRRGVLADPADVFLLDLDELFGFVDGSGTTHDLAGLVEVRRRDGERARRLTPAREFATGDVVGTSVPHVEEPAVACAGQEVLSGLGSCPGRVRGRARVVLSPALGEELAPDTILIARETDPGWLYLMLAARGIVVERGSLLSHTAITGRKFGIPTIVGVPGATARIADGSLIEIDGADGRVRVLEEAAP